jgi:hypothetical protein
MVAEVVEVPVTQTLGPGDPRHAPGSVEMEVWWPPAGSVAGTFPHDTHRSKKSSKGIKIVRIKYKDFNFRHDTKLVIAKANQILEEYAKRGIIVTLRQLYYQFVSRDLIPNKASEYNKLGNIINDARLAGLIDWKYLQDRTRNLQKLGSWENPAGVIASAANGYHKNLWKGQPNYVEVWIEKDALLGVIEVICERLDVPYFSCRGYTSQSEMWAASQRLLYYEKELGQSTYIIHLGDHDPSGKDMSRDIQDRLALFWSRVEVDRIALNMDQVQQYNPPPNPAKITDTRAGAYIQEVGDESWELDALNPDVLTQLIGDAIESKLDQDMFDSRVEEQEEERRLLTKTSNKWNQVSEYVEGL